MSPRRVLITLDAVGGVWRYAIDLARALGGAGVEVVLAGLGPAPSAAQRVEVEALPRTRVEWLDEPLDWMAGDDSALERVPEGLAALALRHDVDLLHLNVPSQAARLRPALPAGMPVVAASHSCVVTWWDAVRRTPLPPEWSWHRERNRAGLATVDVVVAPSRSHGEHLQRVYGPLRHLRVVHNATGPAEPTDKRPFVFAAARWWDEGKGAATLDDIARLVEWPVVAAGACRGGQDQRVELRHAEARGELSHDEVARLMAEASIVTAPSLYEPFGLTVLEGARRGTALVLSDIPTFRELWSDAAYFAPAGDAAAFADAVGCLAADADRRRDLAARAAERAGHFTFERQLDQTLDAYRAATAEARAASAA